VDLRGGLVEKQDRTKWKEKGAGSAVASVRSDMQPGLEQSMQR
jgi:hypothetical protein